MKKPLLHLISLVLLWLVFSCVLKQQTGSPYFSEGSFTPDFFEYHLPAANLALHDRFPIYGFISPMEDYKICSRPDSVKYYRDTETAGVIVFPSKPPLYSLLAGWVYKYFGFTPQSALGLNTFLLALAAALLPVAGHVWLKGTGGIAGILAAMLLLYARHQDVWNFDAELLTTTLCALVLTTAVFTCKKRDKYLHLLLGVSVGLLMLAKGYFALSPLLFAIHYLYQIVREKTTAAIVRPLAFGVGLVMVLLPWVVHINLALQKDIPNRIAFHQKLKATTPQLLLHHHHEIYTTDGGLRQDVIENLLKFHQYQHAIENGFVLISNQLGDYNILNVHNEYCTDGDFHPEWRVISSSFYNQHKDKSKNEKLWLYYTTYPEQIIKLPLAKLRNTMHFQTVFFYSAWFMLILLLFNRNKATHCLAPTYWLLINVLAAVIVFYGDVRFVQTADAASVFVCCLSVCVLFLKKYNN